MSKSLKQELDYLIQHDQTIWETVQNYLIDGFLYIDANDPTHVWASQSFWKMLGYDPLTDNLVSKNWINHLFSEDYEAMKHRLQNLDQMSGQYEVELRFYHQDGSTVWVRSRSILIRNESGHPHRVLSLHTNITQLKQTQHALQKITREYDMVFEGTQDVIFLIQVNDDDTFTYIRANHALQQKTGIPLETIIGKTPMTLLGPDAGMQLNIYYQRSVALKEIISFEFNFDLPHGQGVWWTTLTPLIIDGKVEFIVGSSMDISDRKRLETQLIRLANHDALTGLPNRRYFFIQLDNVIQKGGPFTMLFCDLDGFKTINDMHGHDIGDELLIQVSRRLKESIGNRGIVSRFGGDEFTIIMNSILTDKEISELKKQLIQVIEAPFLIQNLTCLIGVSAGHAHFPEHGSTSRELIKIADEAMYHVKKK
jgi:diguanylate cyclase (GGDEF)-like protein/PAS domain S-box-containing protein